MMTLSGRDLRRSAARGFLSSMIGVSGGGLHGVRDCYGRHGDGRRENRRARVNERILRRGCLDRIILRGAYVVDGVYEGDWRARTS